MPLGLGHSLSHPDHPCLTVNQTRACLVSLLSWQPLSPGPASCTSDTNWETRPCPEAKMGARFHTYKSVAKDALPLARQNRSAGTRKHLDKFDWKAHRFFCIWVWATKKKKKIHKIYVFPHTKTVKEQSLYDWDTFTCLNNKHIPHSLY